MVLRRSLIKAVAGLLLPAPAIVHASSIMPVKPQRLWATVTGKDMNGRRITVKLTDPIAPSDFDLDGWASIEDWTYHQAMPEVVLPGVPIRDPMLGWNGRSLTGPMDILPSQYIGANGQVRYYRSPIPNAPFVIQSFENVRRYQHDPDHPEKVFDPDTVPIPYVPQEKVDSIVHELYLSDAPWVKGKVYTYDDRVTQIVHDFSRKKPI